MSNVNDPVTKCLNFDYEVIRPLGHWVVYIGQIDIQNRQGFLKAKSAGKLEREETLIVNQST